MAASAAGMNHATLEKAPTNNARSASGDAALLARHYEAEKADLGRCLHDGLAQQLTVLSLELSLWQYELEAQPAMAADVISGKLANLTKLVADVMTGTRSISTGLRPRALDSFGVAAALETLVNKQRARLGADCRFKLRCDKAECSPDLGIHLYRIVESILAGIETAGQGVLVELEQSKAGLEVRIASAALPSLSALTNARLRAFNARCAASPGALTITFPA